ncbi:unnamed protein product, partial [Ascophyllum nodosum]
MIVFNTDGIAGGSAGTWRGAYEYTKFRHQIFVPVLLAVISLLRVESVTGPFHKCGDGGMPDCWPVVERQILEA